MFSGFVLHKTFLPSTHFPVSTISLYLPTSYSLYVTELFIKHYILLYRISNIYLYSENWYFLLVIFFENVKSSFIFTFIFIPVFIHLIVAFLSQHSRSLQLSASNVNSTKNCGDMNTYATNLEIQPRFRDMKSYVSKNSLNPSSLTINASMNNRYK